MSFTEQPKEDAEKALSTDVCQNAGMKNQQCARKYFFHMLEIGNFLRVLRSPGARHVCNQI